MANNLEVISRVTRSKEKAAAVYDKLSRWYDLLSGPSERRPRETGLQMLGAAGGETVLEIGVGTGHGVLQLAGAVGPCGRVYGVDLSCGMLRVAGKRVKGAGLAGQVELRCADAAALPFPDDFFQAIFMSFTLELFDTPEIPQVLRECRRVLEKCGRICVVALSKQVHPGMTSAIYELAHKLFPAFVDCRPILVQSHLEDAGFKILQHAQLSMWRLPVGVILGVKEK